MFALSQTTGYAIIALSCMRQAKDGWVQAQHIARCTKIPRPYLQKILHALGQAGLIEAKRGYRGGFALARPPRQISLCDVAEAVEGPKWMSNCMLGLADCSCRPYCPTTKFWRKESARIRAELRRMTIAHVTEYARKVGADTDTCRCNDDATAPGRTVPARCRAPKTSRSSKRGSKRT